MKRERKNNSTEEFEGLTEYDLEVPQIRLPAIITQTVRKTDAELFELIVSGHARESANLQPEDVYFFPAEISNQNLDSYYTRMAENSLRNYADDCNSGVSFQNSHRSRELGIGRVFQGEFIAGDIPIVVSDIYTVRGIKLIQDLSTDDFIRGVDAGLIKDVSIGFKEGENYAEKCSICGNSYWSYDCRHVAGMKYSVPTNPMEDPSNQEGDEEKLCFVWIENARLSEVSAVFDGATPNAMILTKAQREIRAGRMTESVTNEIESRFRINLHDARNPAFTGIGVKQERQNNEKENKTKMELTDLQKAELAKQEAELRAAEFEKYIRSIAQIGGIEVKDETKTEEIMTSFRAKLPETVDMATQAQEFRTSVIDEAIKEGSRAFEKDEFDEEKKRAMLSKLSINEIQERANEWTERADGNGKFKSGRKTKDDADKTDEDDEDNNRSASKVDFVPPSAYGSL